MGKSCKEIAETLVDCMKKSECVRKGGSLKECLGDMTGQEKETTGECQELRTSYFMCKRAGLDMRTRIRGPKSY